MTVPPPLKPGDTVAVVAPAGPFDRLLVLRGMAWLRGRYRVRFRQDLFDRAGFLAGSDQRRRDELAWALTDPDISGVFAARGGHGCLRIVADIPWDTVQQRPPWFVGFSDNTAIHLELNQRGVVSVHGPHVGALGRQDDVTRASVVDTLERSMPAGYDVNGLRPGRATGALVGGNLAVLAACALAGRLRFSQPCVLLLEDVAEAPYRIDRALTALRLGGHLTNVVGIVLGDWTHCRGKYGRTALDVLREHASRLDVPAAHGLRVGHGAVNLPVQLGRTVTLDADAGRLRLQQS